ncbi:acetyltransferase [Candidatus Dependentiae bacterium]|jgi:RimJ/RimL family protein N-acetyltransferase|nr:acetyltransferase [Candidatus Dependentiae bacterium]
MNKNQITFKPLKKSHLPLLAQWFKQPHVAQWWPTESTFDNQSIRDKYLKKITSDSQSAFIVHLGNSPIGYIQCYHTHKEFDVETWGIDQFIGEIDCLGKGYGTQIVKDFVDLLFKKPNIKRIIVDPDPKNTRAIRCYEKVGFRKIGLHQTANGTVELKMVKK